MTEDVVPEIAQHDGNVDDNVLGSGSGWRLRAVEIATVV